MLRAGALPWVDCHTPACNKVTKWQLSYSKVVVPLVTFAYEVQIGSLLNMLSVKSVYERELERKNLGSGFKKR